MLMTHNFFSPLIPQTFRQTSHTSRMLSHRSLPGWLLISYFSIPLKPSFFLIGLKRQLSKIHNSSTSIDTTQSARNLGFIFDEHLSFSDRRIENKIISLTYKILNTTQPSYLYDLVSIQPPHGHNTRSSPYVTLIKPSSSLKVTHQSFRHASPHLWNQLPTSLRIPHPNYSSPSQRPTLCYHLPSLFHCFTLSSKPTFSENLILHLSLFLSVGLISWL